MVCNSTYVNMVSSCPLRPQTVSSRVLYSTKESSPYDVAVVQLQEPLTHVLVPRFTTSFLPGELKELVYKSAR